MVLEAGADPIVIASGDPRRFAIGAREGVDVFILSYGSTLLELGLEAGAVPAGGGRPLPVPLAVAAFEGGVPVEPVIDRLASVRLPSIDGGGCLSRHRCVVPSVDPGAELVCGECRGVSVEPASDPSPPAPPILAFESCAGGEDLVGGWTACRAVASAQPCPLHQMHLANGAGCAPIGSRCGPWPAGADRYVDAAAPTGGDGSMSSPFQTLGAAIASLSGGGVVQIGAGTYAALRVPDGISVRGLCPEESTLGGPVRVEGRLEDVTVTGLSELVAGDAARVVMIGAPEALRVEGRAAIQGASVRGDVAFGPWAEVDLADAVLAPLVEVLVERATLNVRNVRIAYGLRVRNATVAASGLAIDLGGVRLEEGAVFDVEDLSAGSGRAEVLDGARATITRAVLDGLAITGRAEVRQVRVHHEARKEVVIVDGGFLDARGILIDGDLGKAVTATRGANVIVEDLAIVHAGDDLVVVLDGFRSDVRAARMSASSRELMVGPVMREGLMALYDLGLASGPTTAEVAHPPLQVIDGTAIIERAQIRGFGHGIEVTGARSVALTDVDAAYDARFTGSGVGVRSSEGTLDRVRVLESGSDCFYVEQSALVAHDLSGDRCGGLSIKVDGSAVQVHGGRFGESLRGAVEVEGDESRVVLADVSFSAGGRDGIRVEDAAEVILARVAIDGASWAIGMIAGALDMTGGVRVRRSQYGLVVGPAVQPEGLALLRGLELEDVGQAVLSIE